MESIPLIQGEKKRASGRVPSDGEKGKLGKKRQSISAVVPRRRRRSGSDGRRKETYDEEKGRKGREKEPPES